VGGAMFARMVLWSLLEAEGKAFCFLPWWYVPSYLGEAFEMVLGNKMGCWGLCFGDWSG
jgi:hypothetical protein